MNALRVHLFDQEAATLALLTPERPSAGTQLVTLARREEAMAVLVAKSLTNRQVASELSISEHTAATHIRKILKKLGFRSRAELAAWVSEQQPSSSDLV